MSKDPRIRLDERESPESMIKRLVPTKLRLALALYDHEAPSSQRFYKNLPDYRGLVPVYSRKEILALWRLIRDVLESEDWHDERARRNRPGAAVPADGASLGAE